MALAEFHRFNRDGVSKDVYFSIPQTGAADKLFTGTAPVAGDVKISKDGGATANTTNLPTHVGDGIWKLILTATELTGVQIMVTIVDADATPVFGSVFIQISNRLMFDEREGTEPVGPISNDANFRQIMQYLKRRFLNNVTQTSTTQSIFKDDSTTVLTTMAVADDGVTQSKNKSA